VLVTSDVPEARLPAISTFTVDVSPSLSLVRQRTPDGAEWPVGVQDRQANAACEFRTTAEGVRCLPPIGYVESFTFSDPTCMVGAGRPGSGCAGPWLTAETFVSCEAPPKHTVYQTTRTEVYTKTPDGCARSTYVGYAKLGDTLPLARFAEGTLEVPATSPTRLTYRVVKHGAEIMRRDLYDTRLRTRCEPFKTIDGLERCVPPTPGTLLPFYADAECTVRVAQRTCGAYATEVSTAACERPGRRVFELGAPVTALFRREGMACRRAANPVDPTYVQVVREVPPETFELLTPVLP
jgi:hypothetical protein